jgi:WD40 repeat protein
MMHLILWLMLMSRCNPHQMEKVDPRLLPQLLLQHFGEAMLGEIDTSYRMKILMIRLQLRIWSEFLGDTRISKKYMRYLLSRISKRERIYPIPSLLPLSPVVLPRNYEHLASRAVSSAPIGSSFLTSFHHFKAGGTNVWLADLDRVDLVISHKNGNFVAIMVCGGVLIGRKNCPLGLKMHVLKSPWVSKQQVTVCIFHPSDQILIVGFADGTVNFYQVTDDLESMTTPSFTMKLFASLPFGGGKPSCVKRITTNPSGSLFIIEYQQSSIVLVSMDEQNKIATIPFVSALLASRIGGIYSLAFFGENMLITSHYNKYCVWDLSDLGDIKMLSEIEPIICTVGSRKIYTGIVNQIIPCGKSSFIFRTSEYIFLVRLGDDFTTCSIVVELPLYEKFSASTKIDFEHDLITLYGNMLVLVVPSKCIVKFFLLKDDAIHLVLTKKIETPTSWSYDPRTSVFSYYYTSCSFTRQSQFRV